MAASVDPPPMSTTPAFSPMPASMRERISSLAMSGSARDRMVAATVIAAIVLVLTCFMRRSTPTELTRVGDDAAR